MYRFFKYCKKGHLNINNEITCKKCKQIFILTIEEELYLLEVDLLIHINIDVFINGHKLVKNVVQIFI